MSVMQLSPDDCSHCFNLRRREKTRLAEQGASPEYVTEYIAGVLCPEHEAWRAEQQRKAQRRARRQQA